MLDNPILLVAVLIPASKWPSSTNNQPDTQFGSGIFVVWIIALSTGLILLKFDLTISELPKFIDALILTISCRPLTVRWEPALNSSTTCSNNKISAPFWVKSGYFFKWGRLVVVKFLRLSTEYLNALAFFFFNQN